MLELWGRSTSVNVRKVLWLLFELDVEYTHVPAGGAFGKNRTPDFLALNPNGLVPVLRDGDAVVWESNTILRYLAATHPQKGLWPDDALERASADRWLDWSSITFAAPFRDIFWNLVRATPEQRNDDEVAKGISQAGELLAIVDGALTHQTFLSGQRFGIGDIPFALQIQALLTTSAPIASPPAVDGWYKNLLKVTKLQEVSQIPL